MAASVVNCPIARFVQSIFTLKSAKWSEQMMSSQTLKALEKGIRSVYQICTFGQVMPNFCTFGHFMAFLVARDFTSCASNHLLRGQVMPFLRPFYSESDSQPLLWTTNASASFQWRAGAAHTRGKRSPTFGRRLDTWSGWPV